MARNTKAQSTKRTPYNVHLNAEERAALAARARNERRTAAEVVRLLILGKIR